jgi:hypothetical protein
MPSADGQGLAYALGFWKAVREGEVGLQAQWALLAHTSVSD